MSNLIKAFFYGNIYLGFCAVALCIETNLLHHISLNIFPFYVLIFLCTVIYYTMIYVRSVRTKNYTDRTIWYRNNITTIKRALILSIAITVAFLAFIIFKNTSTFGLLSPGRLLLIAAFPLIAAWYTFVPRFFKLAKIRQVGWVKPFIVGLTWTGWVTIYPVVIWQVQQKPPLLWEPSPLLSLCLQNFLFFSLNAIIFDLKDYRVDARHQLRTLPVLFGVRNTLQFIIAPMVFLNLAIFYLFQKQQNFAFPQTLLQLIPYMLMIVIIATYREGRRVLYYLAAVDGLVFLKAFCGITSVLLIKK